MMMAFPTVLTLRTTHNGVRLFNEPVREIAKLQGKSHQFEKSLTFREANENLKGISSDLLHFKFDIENENIMA